MEGWVIEAQKKNHKKGILEYRIQTQNKDAIKHLSYTFKTAGLFSVLHSFSFSLWKAANIKSGHHRSVEEAGERGGAVLLMNKMADQLFAK